jgi:thiol-disulfide isomerase/thioredoxin
MINFIRLSVFTILFTVLFDFQIVAQSTITGQITKPEGTLVVLNELGEQNLKTLDSAYIKKDGSFEFKINNTEELLCFITFDGQKPPGITVIVPPKKKIAITANNIAAYDYQIDGKENASIMSLNSLISEYDSKLRMFNQRVSEMDPSSMNEEEKAVIGQQYSNLVEERTESIKNFIKNGKGDLATYFAALYLFSEVQPPLIFLAKRKLEDGRPKSKYTKRIGQIASQFGTAIEGAPAPEIALEDQNGNIVKLSSLKGKVVLIDFWASWCGPCRRENPHVKKVYDKYKDKGFEIFGVSLDNNKKGWLAAIEKDNLTWYHVSDLQGWSSSAAKLYGVRGIPKTFLLDKDGNILKIDMRASELDVFLADYFAEKG